MGRQEGWLPCSLPRKINRHPIKRQCPASPSPPGARSPSPPIPVPSACQFFPRLRGCKAMDRAQEKQITKVIREGTVHLVGSTLNGLGEENGKGNPIRGGGVGGGPLFLQHGVWGELGRGLLPAVRHWLSSLPGSALSESYPAPRRGRGEEAGGDTAAPCQRRRRRRRRVRRAPQPHLWLVSGLRGLSWPCRRQVSSM